MRNSAIARWNCAPPYSRMLALGSGPESDSVAPSGPTKAPPRTCSSLSVSPKRSAGAATVPRSRSVSLVRNDSRNWRPLSRSLSASRSDSSCLVDCTRAAVCRNSRSSSGSMAGTLSR